MIITARRSVVVCGPPGSLRGIGNARRGFDVVSAIGDATLSEIRSGEPRRSALPNELTGAAHVAVREWRKTVRDTRLFIKAGVTEAVVNRAVKVKAVRAASVRTIDAAELPIGAAFDSPSCSTF